MHGNQRYIVLRLLSNIQDIQYILNKMWHKLRYKSDLVEGLIMNTWSVYVGTPWAQPEPNQFSYLVLTPTTKIQLKQ